MTTTKATVLVVAALAVGTTLYARMGEDAAPARSPDAVVATVNGAAITAADVDVELARMLGFPLDAVPAEQLEAMRSEIEPEILESLIGMQLVQAHVEASEFEAAEADIDEFVQRIESELPESTSLAEQLEAAGVSEAEFRESVADDLRARHVLEGVFADVAEPTDEEIKAFYDENTELFRVEDAEDAVPFEEVRGDIALRIGETRRWEVMRQWVETLKAEATIEYLTAALGGGVLDRLVGANTRTRYEAAPGIS
jgi:hypothetical protein